MKTILVPTDFSKNAYCALHYATQLFRKEETKFIIVHSFENQVSSLTSRVDIGKTEAVVEELYTSSEAQCDEIKHKIILDNPNEKHSYQTIATSLNLFRAVNKLITKEKVNFVVMGSKGVTGAASVFMGQNTRKMIKKIRKAPLLIIPQEMDFTPLKKIAFVTGFERNFSIIELDPLLFVLKTHQALVKVVHIHEKEKMDDDQRKNVHELFEIFRPFKPELNWLQDHKNKFDVVTSYLNEKSIDMLVMVHFKHNFFTKLFREAVVENMAAHITIPFLVIPAID